MKNEIHIFNMPPLQRTDFPDDETFEAALASIEDTGATRRENQFLVDGEVDIAGLDKVALLIALYKNGHKVGMGFLAPDMSDDEIRAYVADYTQRFGDFPYVDYLGGRPLKVDLKRDTFRTHLYDRDNGIGAAAAVVEGLRAT